MKVMIRGALAGLSIAVFWASTPAAGQIFDLVSNSGQYLRGQIQDMASGSEDFVNSILSESTILSGSAPVDQSVCDSCCPPGKPCGYDPVWYVEADALFLNRTRTQQIKLIEDQNESPAPPLGQRIALLTTDALDFDSAWGPRITVGRRLGACRRVELIYYGLHHWQTETHMTPTSAPANLRMPFDTNYTSDFDGAEMVRVHYKSRLHNAEVNYLFDRASIFTPLIGIRYLNLDEEFGYRSTDGGDTSDYLINTKNDLIGLQLGGILDRRISDDLRLSFDAKAGVFVDFANQRTWMGDIVDDNAVVLRDFTRSQGELAFVGELRLGFIWDLTRCVALNAGYQIMWVEGVALAPEQLDYTTTATSGWGLNDDGGVFYDGGYAGVTIRH